MAYWKIKGNNYIMILFEYYMISHSEQRGHDEIFVKSVDLKDIVDDLKRTEENFIFFDMKYVTKAASRAFGFLKEEEILGRIIFFNIQGESEIYDYLDADLHGTIERKNGHYFVYFSDKAKEQFYMADTESIYQQQRVDILKKYVNNEITFLPSSGVYSNMSLDYKKMFEYPRDFLFIINELYYKIRCIEERQRFDFLVAASKNAIVLTAILSSRLGKPAIYHTNIGQKYVKQKFTDKVENQTDNVQKAKKYLMIFDVICLGTEARILNGIINVFRGNLIGAVGMVCVQNPDTIGLLDNDSILAKARCLATAKQMGLEYRIALTREELEGADNEN